MRKLGDPVLREGARPIAAVDDVVRDQIREMRRLLEDAMEAGLAATQVGVLNRVFVYRAEPDGPVHALVNPELEWTSDETERRRGGLPLDPGRVDRGRAAGAACACAGSTRTARPS